MNFFSTPFNLYLELKKYDLQYDGGKLRVFLVLLKLYFKSRFFSRRIVFQKINGFVVQAYDYPTLINLYKEIFLAKVYDFKAETNFPFIIDCGAHMGMSVLFFKMRYPNSRILAFEPNPNLFRLLEWNVSHNHLEGVTLFNCALSSAVGLENFYLPTKYGSVNGSLLDIDVPSTIVRVETRRLSEIIQYDKVDLLKIDVEGAEKMIIHDLATQDKFKQLKHIIVEYHQFNDGPLLSEFVSSIESKGFAASIRKVDVLFAHNQNIVFSFKPRRVQPVDESLSSKT